MGFTFDPATDVGRVRLLIPDRVEADRIFEDAEIEAYLAMEGDSIKLAAALGLETIASDTAMVLKVIKLMDLSTDGAKTSDALLKRAGLLRGQVAEEIAAAYEQEEGFDIAEVVVNDFSARERLGNEVLRGG